MYYLLKWLYQANKVRCHSFECCLFLRIYNLILELFRQGDILELFRQGDILELFRQGDILELFRQGDILELFRQGDILELFQQGDIFLFFILLYKSVNRARAPELLEVPAPLVTPAELLLNFYPS